MLRALKRGDLVALRGAIGSGANLNSGDSQGWTPLFHAARQGNAEAIKLLIQAGVEVNHGKKTGFTALFAAVLDGHVEAVRILLDAGAEIVTVQGIELRALCIRAKSKRHDAILEILDRHETGHTERHTE